MLKIFDPPYSNGLYDQLLTWVSKEQRTRGLNLEIPMNVSMIQDKDIGVQRIYIIYGMDDIVGVAVVVDILKTREYEIGLSARNKQTVRELVHAIQIDLQSANSITIVIDEKCTLEKEALLDNGANLKTSEVQLTVTCLSGKKPSTLVELREYDIKYHNSYRSVLMESFGDSSEEAEAIIHLSLSQTSRTLYGIHIDTEIVGTINLIRTENAYITALAIHPKHQKKGIGRAALHHAVAMLFQEGYTSVSLDVEVENASALKLYVDVGFRLEHLFQFYRL